MIISSETPSFGRKLTAIRAGDFDFVVSTGRWAFLGWCTYFVARGTSLPGFATVVLKPIAKKKRIHEIHEYIVSYIEEKLHGGRHIALILDDLFYTLPLLGYTLECQRSEQFKEWVQQAYLQTECTP
jgi:hypothetical protein